MVSQSWKLIKSLISLLQQHFSHKKKRCPVHVALDFKRGGSRNAINREVQSGVNLQGRTVKPENTCNSVLLVTAKEVKLSDGNMSSCANGQSDGNLMQVFK